MRVHRVGEFWRVARITGPGHNLLGLRFGKTEPTAQPELINLEDAASKGLLDAAEVRRWILEGVTEASREAGSAVHVQAMEYLSSDTPPPDVYKELAKLIVREFLKS